MLDPYRIFWPLLRRIDPERGHRAAILALRAGLGALYDRGRDDPVLATRLWGLSFSNPIGIAAGFDKHAEVPGPAFRLGCGFVEVGGVTPKPQAGNPKPRLFRLAEDRAVINRFGFNSQGLAVVARRLTALRGRLPGPIGVNLGKNKDSEDAAADYAALAASLANAADFFVINVSSPNTPGLRALQSAAPLRAIITATRAARDRAATGVRPVLLLKIAPDLEAADLKDIVNLTRDEALDGLVVGNTTLSRPDSLVSRDRTQAGGLSGAPLKALSTRVLREAYALAEGKMIFVGAGGVSSGADAYAKIRAGASLVQLYSALVYEGPGLIRRITRDLAVLLKRDGFKSVAQAVGADHR
ncbi:MAG: quinone-dependent dihydroorotate dehydrogenase [Rhodospirillaceae bacterium]